MPHFYCLSETNLAANIAEWIGQLNIENKTAVKTVHQNGLLSSEDQVRFVSLLHSRVIILTDYLAKGLTVTRGYYAGIMQYFRDNSNENIWTKRHGISKCDSIWKKLVQMC